MPEYIYKHPQKDKYISLIQKISEDHCYIDESNVKWERVFTSPNISIDKNIDPFSEKQFLEKTKNLKGNVGDLIDASQEMSEKRSKEFGGKDPFKDKFFKKYSDNRKGRLHPKDNKRKKKISKNGIEASI